MSIDKNQGVRSQVDLQQLVTAHRSGVVGAPGKAKTATVSDAKQAASSSFSDLLKSKVDGIKFSAHATSRIKSRNINLTPEVMNKLEKAVSGAADKGARDSLILMRDLAFIVNVPNRTVITAMDGESIRDNVFTNIDSAVIAE